MKRNLLLLIGFLMCCMVMAQTQPRLVRLTVINDNIIRVQATPEGVFLQKSSLIIQPSVMGVANNFQTTIEVGKGSGTEIVEAGNVKAVVDKQTGAVTFYNKSGKLLLKEASHGKNFTKFRVPERELGLRNPSLDIDKEVYNPESPLRNAWSWHALFESDNDEAFYGLGQHQSGDFNMKGKNEDLFQYNTKVSVPFVVSNKNYGILWDSYSYCRFGNPNDYCQLSQVFRLYDKDGKEGSLTGTYNDGNGKQLVRNEDSLYFENSETIVNLPKDIRLDNASVLYEGFIENADFIGGNFQFILYYAGYVKVYLDGKEVVSERWRTAWNPNAWKFDFAIPQGKRVPIKIEWKPDGGVSYCGLRVAKPQTQDEQNRLSIWSEMSRDMDYYFIVGDNIDQVIGGYRTLTGKASILPKWALGFWQSRERYKTQDEVVSTLAEFRKRQIPIDNIVQDWFYWEEPTWGSHVFDKSRYPDPQKMLDDIHRLHGRYMISVWPKFYCTTENYKSLDKHGWMYRLAVKDTILDWVGPGYMGSFYDAYDKGARRMFWQQMNDNLYSKYRFGIDSWWMDASEPNVRDCTPMWYRKALCGPTALGTSTEFFNAYSIVNADAIYNGQRSVNPNQRVFLLTRSGFAGEQKYSTATWSGDIGTRWEDMRAQMTAGLNYSLAGLPFWGMDQGGFCVEKRYEAAQRLYDSNGVENDDLKEWRELQTRWTQFGCFIPLYRTHGQWPTREVFNIAPDSHPAYKSIVYYHKLRYFMMPYIYSLAAWCNLKDYTIMRGLPMDFANDSNVADIKDQWMFGPSLMACPVGEYKARSREVYFPEGGWYDLYSNIYIIGGNRQTVDAPYERIPVFVREGSIIPFGPAMQWSDEKPAELINLYVYEGANGEFMLYEDEGTNYNYECGKYATIDFKYDNSSRMLTIGARKGDFDGMLKQRRFNVVFVKKQNAHPLNLDNPTGRLVKYSGKEVRIKLK